MRLCSCYYFQNAGSILEKKKTPNQTFVKWYYIHSRVDHELIKEICDVYIIRLTYQDISWVREFQKNLTSANFCNGFFSFCKFFFRWAMNLIVTYPPTSSSVYLIGYRIVEWLKLQLQLQFLWGDWLLLESLFSFSFCFFWIACKTNH